MKSIISLIISLVFFVFLISPAMAVKIEIDKSRRPTLKKGDKVRYDKNRNRLGQTVDKK